MQSRYRLIDYLIDNGVLEARGKDEQESVFIVERTERKVRMNQVNRQSGIRNKYTDRNTDGIKRRSKYGKYAAKCWDLIRPLDIEFKIRNYIFEKSAPCKGQSFPRRNYVSP